MIRHSLFLFALAVYGLALLSVRVENAEPITHLSAVLGFVAIMLCVIGDLSPCRPVSGQGMLSLSSERRPEPVGALGLQRSRQPPPRAWHETIPVPRTPVPLGRGIAPPRAFPARRPPVRIPIDRRS